MLDYLELVILAALGLAIGFVGGLVGLVLGVVRLPLILSSELSASIAVGTNIGVSALGALSAAIQHLRKSNLYRRIFIMMATTGAAGAFLGSQLTKYVPVRILLLLIAAVVIYESLMMLRHSRNGNLPKAAYKPSSVIESLIGFGVGFVGGLVGLVLGSIRLPAMIGILKMEPRVAIGTNLAAASVMGASGLIGHMITNSVDYYILGVMGSAAIAGAYLGARFTNRFNARTLKLMIGITLVLVAAILIERAVAFG